MSEYARSPGRGPDGLTLAPGPERVTALLIVGLPFLLFLVIGLVTASGGGSAPSSQFSGASQLQPAYTPSAYPLATVAASGTDAAGPAPASSSLIPASPSVIASPSVTASATSAPSAAAGPAATVQAAYAAINRRDYRTAYSIGLGVAGQSYASYVAGYQSTAHVNVTVTGVQGDIVSVTLTATQTDGSTRTFAGTYTVSGSHITGAQIRQTS